MPRQMPILRKIGICLGIGNQLYNALDTHLFCQSFPIETQRRMRICVQLYRLTTTKISIEHKAVRIDAFEKNHTR